MAPTAKRAGGRGSLQRADIVKAALKLLDEVGIEGLSTRRLAAELGVQGPSLYWHFRNVGELHSHMAEAMMAQVMPSPDPSVFEGDWRAWLAAGAWGLRKVALSRRDGVHILRRARPTGDHLLLNYPAMVARLEAAGFGATDARRAMPAIGRYVLGVASSEQNPSDAEFAFGLDLMLDGLALRRGRPAQD